MDLTSPRPSRRQTAANEPATQTVDTGLAALTAAGLHFGVRFDKISVQHELALGGRKCDAHDLVRCASLVGLRARILTGRPDLNSLPRPLILGWAGSQFALLGREVDGRHEVFFFGADRISQRFTLAELEGVWTGEVLLITRRAGNENPMGIGIKWFLDAAWKYRKAFSHVLVASMFVQLFALITPLLFQVAIDKVIGHQSVSTLSVLCVSLVVIAVFDVVLQHLRAYALAHTASRLDVEFSRHMFSHLLRLPIAYFETRGAGQTVARMRELETIRNFLTGHGLMSLIDLIFTIVFFAVLALYSLKLTLVVALSIPLYTAIALVIRPMLRDRIREQFTRGANSQQFLVESVVGAATVKASAIEPLVQAQWEERLAGYVRSTFDVRMLSNLGQNAIQFVSKLTVAMILFFGAHEVMDGGLSVGELIAFNMIAGQLIAPILRLSQLWQEFQQIQVSVERIGDILRLPTEPTNRAVANLPPLRGSIALRNLSFRYSPEAPYVLQGITLEIPAGQVIGIVGPSGSGKSTLTKLIQRLYVPSQGVLSIDGVEASRLSPAWLRHQIGVVLQENLLFSRTVHENIALASPYLSREEVVEAARLAGADEFIAQLPQGYDTHIEERGSNLSGGQRQRLAIARALARNPRVLILDEATSSLDYESERIIQQNMKRIVRGRTVIIIAHRLAAVRHCDRIISLAGGHIVEDGSHEELLQRPDGLYRRLWSLQTDQAT